MVSPKENNDSDSEKEEGLRLLLGGLDLDISATAWDNESHEGYTSTSSCTEPVTESETKYPPRQEDDGPKKTVRDNTLLLKRAQAKTDAGFLFSRAHKMDPNGRIQAPPVAVVDLSHQGRGNALVATQTIDRGHVIYTEQAALATQVTGNTSNASDIRACQNCFRSLEPIASCRLHNNNNNNCNENTEELPMKHLWPVLDMKFEEEPESSKSTPERIRRDKYGRVQCQACHSYFCTSFCHEAFIQHFGSCCKVAMAKNKLPELMKSSIRTEEEDEEDNVEVQPSIVLAATRMFALVLQRLRTTKNTTSDSNDDGTTMVHSCEFDGLCGEASDIDPLELGVATNYDDTDTDTATTRYTLEPVYNYLVQLWELAREEQNVLTLKVFSSMAAKAARNGFAIRTRSPFRDYYTALLRATGGRNSKRHDQIKQQVARALLGKDNHNDNVQLERGMDRRVDEQVAPELAAIFSLTARINHACHGAANAQVQAQEFVDAHMDVVATRDIERGEEITISYIGGGGRNNNNNNNYSNINRARRQRELWAKYLFHCQCSYCCSGGGDAKMDEKVLWGCSAAIN